MRSAIDFGFFGLKPLIILAHRTRAARILAISMKWFMPMRPEEAQPRRERIDIQARLQCPVRMYSRPSASVYAEFEIGRSRRLPACDSR